MGTIFVVSLMYCLGVDIVEIGRIREAVSRWGERFLQRVYTQSEIDYCRNRAPQLAARFAAKEATMKALGPGIDGVGWRDIEIINNQEGAPSVYLRGRARARSDELGLAPLAISLSHSREHAIASVLGERK